jgi:hypothetical protein
MKVRRILAIVLLFISLDYTDCYILSVLNSRKKNTIVRNKKGIEYRKFLNENEKYLYANYLVSLRKIKKAQRAFNNLVNDSSSSIGGIGSIGSISGIGNNEGNGNNESNEMFLNIENSTVLNNNEKIARNLILANIKIDVSNVKYIQISTKNDTIVVELDKNNENNEKSFVNYDLGKIDALISAISILMNLLNIH